MNILYIDYQMYGKDDIVDAFQSLGYKVDVTDLPLKVDNEKSLAASLEKLIAEGIYTAAFTSNYYPLISEVCQKTNIKYISWTYDSPLISLYHPSIQNPCNYTFIFDSRECENLKSKGVTNVFYMPLAVNDERLSKIVVREHDKELFSADVSLVASLYNETHNLYDRMEPRLSKYTNGYLNGVIQAQKNLFGVPILENALENERVYNDMYCAMPYKLAEGSLATERYVYANYFLARKVATFQRMEFIREISQYFDMKVYTGGDLSSIKTVKHIGTVDYLTDMNKVFRLSKINLNITLPSIHAGVPLRAMDIMGNGGFLLTNYQSDLLKHFEPNKEFVYYTSLDEALYYIDYYLNHEDERIQIAQNAKRKMETTFTYKKAVKKIMELINMV
ncbi:MAG: glycosyltransferase [Lachnospiraceae bacterium]|nr:glycosyltransferase [Lachnospiraceae bacterium]